MVQRIRGTPPYQLIWTTASGSIALIFILSLYFFSIKLPYADLIAVANIILFLIALMTTNIIIVDGLGNAFSEMFCWFFLVIFGAIFGLIVGYVAGFHDILLLVFVIVFAVIAIIGIYGTVALVFVCYWMGYAIFNAYQNASASWIGLPLFIVPLFAYIGYIISTVIIGPEAKGTLVPKKIVERMKLKKELEDYKYKVEEWKSQGYNLSKLEKTFKLKNLSEKVKNLRHHEKTIQKLKHFEQELFSLSMDGYESEVQSIQEKLKNPNKIDATELEFLSLKLRIERARIFSSGKKPDYYEILGIKRNATSGQIKTIYRKLATIYHPDKGKHLGVSGDKIFREIKDAYETLIDTKKRKEYNRKYGIK